MDSVTQILLGAAVGEAAFRPKLGWKAVAFGAGCGLLPDLDVVTRLGGDLAFIVHHRGFSHSLIVLAMISPVLGWLGYRWAGRCETSTFWIWTHLAFWALITHALLDWCTSYGTQLFWPLTHHRYAIDAVSILDPIYSTLLVLVVLVGFISRIPERIRRGVAIAGLSLSTAYLGLGYLQSQRALALTRAQLSREGLGSAEIFSIRAMPTLLNIWVWRMAVRDQKGTLRIGLLSVWNPKKISYVHYRLPDDPLIQQIQESETGKILHWFSMDVLSYALDRTSNGTLVEISDQRFGLFVNPAAVPFRTEFIFDSENSLQGIRYLRKFRPIEFGEEIGALWAILTGAEQAKVVERSKF